MKRSPILRKTRLKPMSAKRNKDSKAYSLLRDAYLRLNPICEICIVDESSEIHHREGRGRNYLNTDTWLAVCRRCHKWIHTNPSLARKQGYLK